MVKVRFAPSPTGIPHIGNIRTALFNYFFAKKEGGKFILRIEDTDQARKVPGAEEAIEESLKWLGISWDEKIVQSEHLEEYKKYAQELVSKNLAKREDGAIRFITPNTGKTSWTDKVGSKRVEFENKDIEDFIILKADGFPTYHLANVIDDKKQEITHVIRGEDWITSTPKHILLYKVFGWETPEFVHVPNILGPDKSKLSKRRRAKSVLDFKNEGFLPEALLNYLMLLGWSPKDDREILGKEVFVKEFSLENIHISPAIFDQRKLEWMNGEYIRQLSNEELLGRLLNFYSKDKMIEEILKSSKANDWISAASSRMKTLNDFKELVSEKPSERASSEEESKTQKKLFEFLLNELGNLDIAQWENEAFLTSLKKFSKQEKIPFKTIYFLLTGKEHGIGLLELNEIYGKDFFIKNLKS